MSLILQNYQIIDKIGEGSQAQVFSCVLKSDVENNTSPQKKFVLRVQHITNASHFTDEFRLISSLQTSLKDPAISPHPNLVSIIDVDIDPATSLFYVIMEHYTNGDLLSYMARMNRHFTNSEILKISTDVATALSYLHSCNLSHGDVKLENVLVTGELEKICLSDFGCVKSFQRSNRDKKKKKNKRKDSKEDLKKECEEEDKLAIQSQKNVVLRRMRKGGGEEEEEKEVPLRREFGSSPRGSPCYVAPEQYFNFKIEKEEDEEDEEEIFFKEEDEEEGERYVEYLGTKGDVYSLGVAIFALLTRKFPFGDADGENYYSYVIDEDMRDEIERIRERGEKGRKKKRCGLCRRRRRSCRVGGRRDLEIWYPVFGFEERVKDFFEMILALDWKRRPTALELIEGKRRKGVVGRLFGLDSEGSLKYVFGN